MSNKVLNIIVTGAAGRISYSLIPFLLDGSIWGDRKISLRLYDIAPAEQKLQGIKMEILDSGFTNLDNVIATVDGQEAFEDADIAILLGGFPRLEGMQRKDLIMKNAEGMMQQGRYLNEFASRDVKVLVIANPANTNCLVAMKSAKNIPATNFTCLTRLDQERLRGFLTQIISEKFDNKINSADVKDVSIFGNHSVTQVPYFGAAMIVMNNKQIPVNELINEDLNDELVSKVQNRGAAIIKALQASSALSAAVAIQKHLKDWLSPTEPQEMFSMGVLSNGNSYDIPDGLVYSFPCKRGTKCGEYSVVSGLEINQKVRLLLEKSTQELCEERLEASAIVGDLE